MEGIEPARQRQQQHPDPATTGDELEELRAAQSRRSQAGTAPTRGSDIRTPESSMASSYHRLNALALPVDATPPSHPPAPVSPCEDPGGQDPSSRPRARQYSLDALDLEGEGDHGGGPPGDGGAR